MKTNALSCEEVCAYSCVSLYIYTRSPQPTRHLSSFFLKLAFQIPSDILYLNLLRVYFRGAADRLMDTLEEHQRTTRGKEPEMEKSEMK